MLVIKIYKYASMYATKVPFAKYLVEITLGIQFVSFMS